MVFFPRTTTTCLMHNRETTVDLLIIQSFSCYSFMNKLPTYAWKRDLDEDEPSGAVHAQFKPYFVEALSLLPVAYRIGSYIYNERSQGRDPIFDLHGITLSPPHPGPHAGVPLGGMGCGAIGRGFKGEFRRWSLHPGKYHHHVVEADLFALRVKRGNTIDSTVLSLQKPANPRSCLHSWDWNLSASCGSYHAVFPLAWSVYDDPVPNVKVTIKQISPFLPHNYAESSLPTACFEIEIENKSYLEDIEVSVMFVFQNGTENYEQEVYEDYRHFPFHCTSLDSTIQGICMPHRTKRVTSSFDEERYTRDDRQCSYTTINNVSYIEDKASFAIAAHATAEQSISYCEKFISIKSNDEESLYKKLTSVCASNRNNNRNDYMDDDDESTSAHTLWQSFKQTGQIHNVDLPYHKDSTICSSAICVKQVLPKASYQKTDHLASISFALAWDHPIARFGSGLGLPRFYTKFGNVSGKMSPLLASYALKHGKRWYNEIWRWQNNVIAKIDEKLGDDHTKEDRVYYYSQVFNELYFLVDGGSIWTDSKEGRSNQCSDLMRSVDETIIEYEAAIENIQNSVRQSFLIKRDRADQGKSSPLEVNIKLNNAAALSNTVSISTSLLHSFYTTMHVFNLQTESSNLLDQSKIGQFLYLEGHEYLMYNTYDVHFYASFALLQLFPLLELSVQVDFERAVEKEDKNVRRMMGEGDYCARKTQGFLPHDLGSPSEEPWTHLNAYNFQDVSRWKDLGTKFVLQVYRNFFYLSSPSFSTSSPTPHASSPLHLLTAFYPTLLSIMRNLQQFTNSEHMIENSGFPDQTYDIWTATGVHAYCGGLWLTACEAMLSIATLLQDSATSSYYANLLPMAKKCYVDKLWNGLYLDYDSSESSYHDSIMADMLAGQWYALSCHLPPPLSAAQSLSCLRTIYKYNVLEFGQGKFIGAVNGMRPPTSTSPAVPDGSCIQSREVWTGTTYALSAVMLLEAQGREEKEKKELLEMAFNTARGVHDGGWQEFGYWFATPEAWFGNGNYRSMGYMRPLSIWAMQFALEKEEQEK